MTSASRSWGSEEQQHADRAVGPPGQARLLVQRVEDEAQRSRGVDRLDDVGARLAHGRGIVGHPLGERADDTDAPVARPRPHCIDDHPGEVGSIEVGGFELDHRSVRVEHQLGKRRRHFVRGAAPDPRRDRRGGPLGQHAAEPAPPLAAPDDDHVRRLAGAEAVDRPQASAARKGGPQRVDLGVVVDIGVLVRHATAAAAADEHGNRRRHQPAVLSGITTGWPFRPALTGRNSWPTCSWRDHGDAPSCVVMCRSRGCLVSWLPDDAHP